MNTLGTILSNILNVFFGTVRRAGWTLAILAALYFMHHPDDLKGVVRGMLYNIIAPLFRELATAFVAIVGPFVAPLLAIAIMLFGFTVVLRGAKRMWRK